MIVRKDWFRYDPPFLTPITIQGIIYSSTFIILLILGVLLPIDRIWQLIITFTVVSFVFFDILSIFPELINKEKEKQLFAQWKVKETIKNGFNRVVANSFGTAFFIVMVAQLVNNEYGAFASKVFLLFGVIIFIFWGLLPIIEKPPLLIHTKNKIFGTRDITLGSLTFGLFLMLILFIYFIVFLNNLTLLSLEFIFGCYIIFYIITVWSNQFKGIFFFWMK